MKVAMRTSGKNHHGIRPVRTAKAARMRVEQARRVEEILSDGRTKSLLYLFASCSVDEPYSWTYLKSRLSMIEARIRAIEEAKTNSGLILTPSVSSSKKRRRPALEAGRGLFFLLTGR